MKIDAADAAPAAWPAFVVFTDRKASVIELGDGVEFCARLGVESDGLPGHIDQKLSQFEGAPA
jgi:hypothetical protein